MSQLGRTITADRQLVFAEIKQRLGVSRLRDAAERLGLAPTALENLTRPNRVASPEILAALREHLPYLDSSALENKEDVSQQESLRQWHENLTFSVTRWISQSTVGGEFGSRVADLFKTLKSGDVYLLFTYDQKPVELNLYDPNLKSIQDAINAGAHLVYFLVEQAAADKDHGNLDHQPSALKTEIDKRFKERISVGAPDAVNKIDTFYIDLAALPLFVRGIKFALILSETLVDSGPPSNLGAIASISVPVAGVGDALLPLQTNLSNYLIARLWALQEEILADGTKRFQQLPALDALLTKLRTGP